MQYKDTFCFQCSKILEKHNYNDYCTYSCSCRYSIYINVNKQNDITLAMIYSNKYYINYSIGYGDLLIYSLSFKYTDTLKSPLARIKYNKSIYDFLISNEKTNILVEKILLLK